MLPWHQSRNGLNVTGLGWHDLLDLPMTAFFASRQCPGTAIHAAMDWALQQARDKTVVISGFHAPLEQSVLTVLLEARSPAVVMLARPADGAKLPPAWAEPLAQGRLAVVSTAQVATRLTNERAAARNDHVAQLAATIVVAYASLGGALAYLCAKWQAEGRSLVSLSS